MTDPIQIGNVIDANQQASAFNAIAPETQAMIDALLNGDLTPEQFSVKKQNGEFVAPTLPPPVTVPANRYAPTGWRKKQSVEFDIDLPSGQVVRIRRLERNDLFRLKIMDHLDDLLPLLIDPDLSEAEKDVKLKEAIGSNKNLIDNMYSVIDVVVMACCLNPMVCADSSMASYGSEVDQADPNFVSVVHIDDIDIDDRQIIFSAAFGSDASHLKSVQGETPSVEPLPAVESVLLPSERNI